jgi:hypothetical protein
MQCLCVHTFRLPTRLSCYFDCISFLNPLLYRQNKIIASGRIFNCTEFGIIKIGIEQNLPFTGIFNRVFKAESFNNDMLSHLTVCHIGKRNVVEIVNLDNGYVGACYIYFCHIYLQIF